MKAAEQSFHHQRGQSRARKEAHSQELDDIRVAEGAHQLKFFRELSRDFGTAQQEIVDFLGSSADWYRHLLHAAVGAMTYCSASELNAGQDERPQLRMVMKEIIRHFSRTLEELDRYIAPFVQEAVKKDGKGPYSPNSDNCRYSAMYGSTKLYVQLCMCSLHVYGYRESAS